MGQESRMATKTPHIHPSKPGKGGKTPKPQPYPKGGPVKAR